MRWRLMKTRRELEAEYNRLIKCDVAGLLEIEKVAAVQTLKWVLGYGSESPVELIERRVEERSG